MNINKKSITLIELLFTIIISSILLVSVANISLDLNNSNKINYYKNILKIEFESTRLFLQKQIINDKNLSNLSYKNNNLYFKNNILLKNLLSYNRYIQDNIIVLDICIKNKIKLCQKIRIKDGI